MSHLDEGTLHALLDGELDTHEVAEIQAHLGSCSSCGLRLREVKEFLTEADGLIASVNLDSAATPPPRISPMPAAPSAAAPSAAPEEPAPPAPRPEPAAQPAAQPAGWEPWNEPPPPVLLIPENESVADRRMRRMRRLGWAAILLVIAGAGWMEARKMMPVGPLPADSTISRTTAVVSPEETSPRPDSGASTGTANAYAGRADSALPRSTALATRKPAAPPPARPSATGSTRAAKPASPAPAAEDTGTKTLASRDEAGADSTPTASEDGRTPDSASDGAQTDAKSADKQETEDLATVRARASEALADLDRERRLKQAAAATAALDAQRRTAQPQAARAPAPAPTPPTLEQRARIYLRIGLDEASRQLGGPTHVIEGLSPLFMGLVQGTAVPGADDRRAVVRVVYQDSQGRLILLDQQRLRSGQPVPQATALSWTIGSTAMWLNGEAPPEVLRTYRPRVR
jgi:hypothetical protein